MTQHASGTFEITTEPLPPDFPELPTLGRFTIRKVLHGGIEATATGQMLTSTTATKGSAAYVAVEVLTGTLNGHHGSFSLVHRGIMDHGEPTATVTVVPDSGTGALTGLAGTFTILRTPDGKHAYEFDYTLTPAP